MQELVKIMIKRKHEIIFNIFHEKAFKLSLPFEFDPFKLKDSLDIEEIIN